MFEIAGRKIGLNYEPYIIAELSGNHNGSLEKAKESIRNAKASGAHAIKLQTYTADTMTIDSSKPDFMINGGAWNGYKLYDLYAKAHTPYEWHKDLFDFANEINITIFSTPFDSSAIELLEKLNAPAYKIASFEITDTLLIKEAAKTRKPLLISTGMASEEEISEAIMTAQNAGAQSILLFHCISSYPTPIEDSNLKKIINLRKTYGVEVGLSDHTLGTIASVTAIAMGASAIEKHFTLSRSDNGPDSEFSIEPQELSSLVRDTKYAWLALGNGNFQRPDIEQENKVFRRSIYFIKNLKCGEIIRPDHIRRIRPGFGIPPKYFDQVLGSKVARDVERGDPVLWSDLEKGKLS